MTFATIIWVKLGFNDTDRAAIVVKQASGKHLTYRQAHQYGFQDRGGTLPQVEAQAERLARCFRCALGRFGVMLDNGLGPTRRAPRKRLASALRSLAGRIDQRLDSSWIPMIGFVER